MAPQTVNLICWEIHSIALFYAGRQESEIAKSIEQVQNDPGDIARPEAPLVLH
jgi:hypothetical protein